VRFGVVVEGEVVQVRGWVVWPVAVICWLLGGRGQVVSGWTLSWLVGGFDLGGKGRSG
jgi:hypothetical protein